jgi:hypothetical protein
VAAEHGKSHGSPDLVLFKARTAFQELGQGNMPQGNMPKKSFALCVGSALLPLQFPALADLSGCADSPESPTAMPALLGAAAGGMTYTLTTRGARHAVAGTDPGERS